jgi:hypothetical protein
MAPYKPPSSHSETDGPMPVPLVVEALLAGQLSPEAAADHVLDSHESCVIAVQMGLLRSATAPPSAMRNQLIDKFKRMIEDAKKRPN